MAELLTFYYNYIYSKDTTQVNTAIVGLLSWVWDSDIY